MDSDVHDMDIYSAPDWIDCLRDLSVKVGCGQYYRPKRKKVLVMDDEKWLESPPRGRPPKPVAEARTRRTVTFLTEGEYNKLVDIARRNNMSISAVAHKLLIQSISSWH
jgi:hypothetical protein